MPAQPRHGTPLTQDAKVNFPTLPGIGDALTDMAHARGISRSEYLRRLVCGAIVVDQPAAFVRLKRESRERIEQIAGLPV